jgi:hypothetical protein
MSKRTAVMGLKGKLMVIVIRAGIFIFIFPSYLYLFEISEWQIFVIALIMVILDPSVP